MYIPFLLISDDWATDEEGRWKEVLYPTHKRYGQAYAFIGIPIAVFLGYFPGIDFGSSAWMGELLVVLMFGYAAYRGALFGAEFPDIDSPNSKPAQKHYLLKIIFQTAGVKHRGKFSHDFMSLLILFGLIYVVWSVGIGGMMDSLLSRGVGSSELTPLVALLSSDGLLMKTGQMYIVFVLVGAYSHLIADAMTAQGVWIFWSMKVHFVPVFLKKVKIFGHQPFKSAFRTGSHWEDFNYWGMTAIGIIAFGISLLSVIQI